MQKVFQGRIWIETVFAVTVREKLSMKLALTSSYHILTQGQPFVARILYHPASGRVATWVSIIKSLVKMLGMDWTHPLKTNNLYHTSSLDLEPTVKEKARPPKKHLAL